eukprot:8753521-Lingulodinium_polyedra.AAC.1
MRLRRARLPRHLQPHTNAMAGGPQWPRPRWCLPLSHVALRACRVGYPRSSVSRARASPRRLQAMVLR